MNTDLKRKYVAFLFAVLFLYNGIKSYTDIQKEALQKSHVETVAVNKNNSGIRLVIEDGNYIHNNVVNNSYTEDNQEDFGDGYNVTYVNENDSTDIAYIDGKYVAEDEYGRVSISNPEADAHRIYSDPMIYWKTVYPDNADYLYYKIQTTTNKKVVDSFIKECGGYFILTDLDTVHEESVDDAVAFYWCAMWSNGAIVDNYICIEDRMESIDIALNHEIGHFVDTKNGSVSNTDEWYAIYDAYKNVGCFTEYGVSNPTEFFADCYKYYVEGDIQFINNCQVIYEYMMTMENNI